MSQSRRALGDSLNALCKDSDAFLQGAGDGPLSGLTFAAKDISAVATKSMNHGTATGHGQESNAQ